MSDNQEENLKLLQQINQEWNSIGFVPYKDKDRIKKLYQQAIEEKFGQVNLDAESRKKLEFEQKLKNILASNNPKRLIVREIEKYKNQISKLKAEVLKLENNLEMFKDSPEELLKDFKDKIAKEREKIKVLEQFIATLVKEYKKLS